MAGAEKITYILALGSNVGDRPQNLALAIAEISRLGSVLGQSKVVETLPILIRAQGRFLNQGICISSNLAPHEMLENVIAIEKIVGRKKRIKNGPREIDIDIVWCSAGRIESRDLTVPHPHNRAREWIRDFMDELKPEIIDETGVAWARIKGRSIMNVHDFAKKKSLKEKITMVTCYDHAFARLVARSSIDTILVGDSLGNVIQGNPNTLAVTLDDMIYHARAVRRGAPQAFIVVDMPFMTYQSSERDALLNAGRIIKETGCDAVKLEGGERILPQVRALVEAGIPVMGHLGLTPQSLLAMGGYRVQGKNAEAADRLIADAKKLEAAGAFAVVLEMVPQSLTKRVSETITIPTIGIGAGVDADGQVLVITDLLGLDPDFTPKFARKYANLSHDVLKALEEYAAESREKKFPSDGEAFS